MNNQEKQTNGKHADGLSKRRLFLKKAGVAAPVLLTLTSPSVFGGDVWCLSQQLSGTHSNQTPLCYVGTYKPSTAKANLGAGGFTVDTVFSDEFTGGDGNTFGFLLDDFISNGTHLSEAYFITALLNAKSSTPGNPYVLTDVQVKALYAGGYPAITDKEAFLFSTFPA